MRELFPSYYRPTEDELSHLWDTCLFVLDANALLNLYEYSADLRERSLALLGKLSDRLWMPHQVALEYHRRRPEVIWQQVASFRATRSLLVAEARKPLEEELTKRLKRKEEERDTLVSIVERAFREIHEKLGDYERTCAGWLEADPIRDRLEALFGGKMGSPYSRDELEDIYARGERRYQREVPPGYGDAWKGGVAQYGDLVVWLQIIDRAKAVGRPIIFVTSDERKGDWYWLYSNGNAKDPQPRPELREEMMDRAGVWFYMYRPNDFLNRQSDYLETSEEIPEEAIQEAAEVERERESRGSLASPRSPYGVLPGYLDLLRTPWQDTIRAAAEMADWLEDIGSSAAYWSRAFEDYERNAEAIRNIVRSPSYRVLEGLGWPYVGARSRTASSARDAAEFTTSGASMENLSPSEQEDPPSQVSTGEQE